MFIKCVLLLFVFSFIEADYRYRPSSQTCLVPRIPHGRARPRQRGSVLKYSCSPLYTLVGNRYATCRYGHWDEPTPICVRSGCPPLPEVKNAVNVTSHNNAWIVFFCVHGHELVGSPVVFCDGSQWNATIPGCYDSTAKLSTECDFEESNICGWKQDDLHDFDWRRWTKNTPSAFLQTGPTYDHTHGKNGTGYYMYIESTGAAQNDSARLLSPVYDAELAKNGCFIFYYHMFGRSMGGLRVYQKPDRVSMYRLLSRPQTRKLYTLFEKWGDQGNEWYTSVSMLSDVSDDFQIVIEGIRGDSFMGDIAIDDVSIQHGENCSRATIDATTPPTVLQESCVGRCDQLADHTGYRGCSCNLVCVIHQNCCPDFLDVCDLDSGMYDTSTASSNITALPPQTQKLIATTTETLPPTPTSTTSSSTSTTTTTSTTSTTTTTTTTPKPTTRRRTTTSTTSRTTTKAPTTSTTTTTSKPTTRRRSTTTTTTPRTSPTPRATTKAVPPITTRKPTTWTIEVNPISSTTILFAQTTKHDAEVKTNTDKTKNAAVVEKKPRGMSGATVAVTVLLVGVAFVGACWIAYVMTRSSRGMAALARIRGRATSDPEVHYLKADVDDE